MRVFLLICCFVTAVWAKSPEISIQLHSGNQAEQKGKQLIEGFLQTYDLTKFIFTKTIVIQSMVKPHSHPVLTLNTRLIDQPDRYLSTFLHEQIHWFLSGANEAKTNKFVEEITKEFPEIPTEANGGARDRFSTYLHLGVGYLEYQALSGLIGEGRARAVFEADDVYPWVTQQVLKKGTVISEALQRNGLVL